MFCKLFFGYAPGVGTPDTTIPHWVVFRLCFSCVHILCSECVGLNSTVGAKYCVFSLVPLDCFAVTDPEASRSLINSVAASVFPSDCCNKDNKRTRPKKPVITLVEIQCSYSKLSGDK